MVGLQPSTGEVLLIDKERRDQALTLLLFLFVGTKECGEGLPRMWDEARS